MFTCQYWNERDAQWKPCGVSSPDLNVVRQRQFQMIKQTRASGAGIRFRVIHSISTAG